MVQVTNFYEAYRRYGFLWLRNSRAKAYFAPDGWRWLLDDRPVRSLDAVVELQEASNRELAYANRR